MNLVESRESRVESQKYGKERTTFAFPRPPSPFRLGISLTEVLIAMGILTVGLLGVAAVFPVGSFYMHKAEIADRGSAIAQSVMNDIVTKGMLNPNSWVVMVPGPRVTTTRVWNTGFQYDSKYCPSGAPTPGTFTRPFALSLNESLLQAAGTNDTTLVGKQFGAAFVIDPLGVSAMTYANVSGGANMGTNVIARGFPGSIYQFGNTATTLYNNAWLAWGSSTSNTWPIRRVTFQQGDGWQMSPAIAEQNFRGNDDLTTDFPKRDDRPAQQNWDVTPVGSGVAPLARKWTGDYSWIVTVVPTTTAARDGMARDPEGNAYDVSVVVFYKRPLPVALPQGTQPALEASAGERAVRAKIVSTGLNGGEILLEKIAGDSILTEPDPFTGLKSGQWIMLCGPHPNSNAISDNTTSGSWRGEPQFVMNWYQVLSIESESNGVITDPTNQRLLAVRGPEWPWQPTTLTYGNALSNNLCAAICRGAVAVHRKTMRLEGSRDAGYGTGMSVVQPPGSPEFHGYP
jgi:hypothetical protein